jgi:hypothetical protein
MLEPNRNDINCNHFDVAQRSPTGLRISDQTRNYATPGGTMSRHRALTQDTTPWTEQEISDLSNYWKLGMTAREISEKIATRSIGAIAGKIKRLRANKNVADKPAARRHAG